MTKRCASTRVRCQRPCAPASRYTYRWTSGQSNKGILVFDSEFERNLFELRQSKLVEIEKLGQAAYPNQFPSTHTIPEVRAKWNASAAEELEANRAIVDVAGRIM